MSEGKIMSGEIAGHSYYGLYGAFYKNPLFDTFLLGNHGDHEGGYLNFMGSQSFHEDLTNQSFHSARWQGRIVIPEDAVYLFNTSDNSRVCIQLEEYNTNKKIDILKEGHKNSQPLKKGLYKILIEYIPLDSLFDNQNVLILYWESAKKGANGVIHPIKKQVIPKENLLMPDVSDENAFLIYPRQTLFEKFVIPNNLSNQASSKYDSGEYYSSTIKSPLSAQLIERLQKQKDDMHSAQIDINLQYQRWEEARQSTLKYAEWEKEFYHNQDEKKNLDPDYDKDNPNARHADADGDGLSNYNSTNGFTVIGASHRPWLPEYEKDPAYKEYPKYTCSYRKASTAGDPYTDLQKALGNVSNLLPVTRNPLIAAAPCVSAQMEGYSISTIEDVTITEEKGFHFTTSNRLTVSNTNEKSKSEEHSEEIHANIGISPEGRSINGGGGLSWSHGLSEGKSNTNSVESSSDSTTDQANTFQKHWNTGDRAYFNAYVRYVNTGTASMLKAKPSLNFGVYNKHLGKVEPVSSVTPPEKTAGEILNLEGDSFYPSQELMPLVIQTRDTFNSQRITLSQEQWESVLSGHPMRLEVPQVEGLFQGKINNTKDPLVPNVNTDYEWTNFLPNIDNNTACITLVLPDGKIYDRKIAAPKVSTNKAENELGNGVKNRLDLYADQNKVPVLTIGKAIQIAFDTHPNSFIFNNKAGIEYDLNRANINLILDEHTNTLLQKQYKEKLEKDSAHSKKSIGSYYDLDLYQGMRIVIEVPPAVTAELKEATIPNNENQPLRDRQILLQNHYTKKTIYYTITINPPEILKGNNQKTKKLSTKGILKPGEKTQTKLEYLSDQDVLKVFIAPDERTEPKLLFSKPVAKLPGFITEKERVDISSVKQAYQFSSWVGDATQQSKCKGIEFFVFPKEHWDNIATFELTVETTEKGKPTLTNYGPLLKTELDNYKNEADINGSKGYKVYLDFSLFKTWHPGAIQLGDKLTINGKINEVKKRVGWDKVKACKKGENCDFNNVYIPYEEPRTCTLYQGEFPPRSPWAHYKAAFKDVKPNKGNNVASLVNSQAVPSFDNVLKDLTFHSVDPIILTTIKEFRMELEGQEPQESATLIGHKLEDGNLKLSFRTETIVKVEREHESDIPIADLFFKGLRGVDEMMGGVDFSHDTYNAAVPGLLSGKNLKIKATIDERALLKEDLAQFGNSIVIYEGRI
ncbi:hypothetical protein P4V47_03945 [Brevibacillus laterosporus]|uniref:binary toxin-like calcium binding domain-containing protein n=1 Tax=Brevibacillus laterosporus TaxID=1465 RepID=UPI002E1C4205|nr:hypothetical protein [Brevibacillus laterosporus]